jgi:hypothetical protein
MNLATVKDTRQTTQLQSNSASPNLSPVKVTFNYNQTASTGVPLTSKSPLITLRQQPTSNLVIQNPISPAKGPAIVQGQGPSLIRTGKHPSPVHSNIRASPFPTKSTIIGGRNQVLTPLLMSRVPNT